MAQAWGLKVTERQKLNVFEMKCLRSMLGVSQLDRDRNEVVRARTLPRGCFIEATLW